MNSNASEIVQKLWNLCSLLREDGITYHQYVAELAFVLFPKMAKETKREEQLPKGYRWDDLATKDGVEQLNFYRGMLLHLGTHGSKRVQDIYANASTSLRQPKNLNALVKAIDGLDWYSTRREDLGDLYEGLLEKNATEVKSGAGQYFTPRPLVESMVAVVKPAAGEAVQDPAAGTGGFLIAADRYVRSKTDNYFDLKEKQQEFQRKRAFYGVELVPETRRLALMNMALHDLDGDVILGDTLSPTGKDLPKADVIITNPPFGTKKGGGKPERDDFTFPTSNKQLAFVEHIYRGLKPGGRAAVVVPDNVLFEDNVGQQIREDLMDKCDLHTILRLPTGIFYAQGVKTNVLFFSRGATDRGNTKAVWVYDMRTNAPAFGKRTPFLREHFAEFEKAFGDDAFGKSKRKDQGVDGRFRKFTRDEVKARGDNLDLAWLKEEGQSKSDDLPEPEVLLVEIRDKLEAALTVMSGMGTVVKSSSRSRTPPGWIQVKLDDVAEVRLGRQRSPDRATGPNMVPYLRAANVTWAGVDVTDVKEMDFTPKEQETYRLRRGDIILSEASGSASEVGKPALWRDEVPGACFQNTLIRVRSKGPLAEFLCYQFFFDARSGRFADAGKGIGINHLGAERMSSWPVALPPLEEQRRIVAKLESLLSQTRRARELLVPVTGLGVSVPPESLLGQLDAAFFAKAFRGELVPQDPTDEPASVLLERIKAERGQLKADVAPATTTRTRKSKVA